MTLRPEYSLGHSAYNDFLFGSLGPDAAGTEVTMLSALSRLGIDPWEEAARLASLPRDAAAEALVATILQLPDRTGASAEVPTIAVRLVALLPEGAVADIPQTKEARVASLEAAVKSEQAGRKMGRGASVPPTPPTALRARAGLTPWLIWGALAFALYLLIVQLTPTRDFEPVRGETQQGS